MTLFPASASSFEMVVTTIEEREITDRSLTSFSVPSSIESLGMR
jgi:hypothetical protein